MTFPVAGRAGGLPAAELTVYTGEVSVLAYLPAHDLAAAVLLLATADTETRRNRRWRVRPERAQHLPPELAVLGSGRQSGLLSADAPES